MNILITGANGFIGQALCKKMLLDGYQVRGAVRGAGKDRGQMSDLEGLRAEVGDIGPETDWYEALKGIDGIVHLAARVHVMRESAADPLAEFCKVNTAGTLNLARQAVAAGVKRFVFISTVKVNGEGTGKRDERPTSNEKQKKQKLEDYRQGWLDGWMIGMKGRKAEGGSDPYTEMDKPEPRDPYAVSKWEAEQGLLAIAADTGMEVVMIRPPLVYGPEVRGNFLRLLRIVWRGIPLPLASIKNRRSLIYIGNLVDAIVNCMTNPNAAGKTYLVSDGDDVSTPDLIRRIAAASGRRALMLPVPVWMMRMAGKIIGRSDELERLFGSLTVDISKICRELNWKPPNTPEEGIRETVLWYKSAD